MKKLKLMTVVGTRPEIIRLSRVMAVCDQYFDHVLVHTGQNYDYELNEIFFTDLGIRKPDHFLNAAGATGAETIGNVIIAVDKVLEQVQPEALLVLGDTNSCLAAYMAKRLHIPVFHMEAGNRSFDFNVHEETNRRVIDHIADYNLVYTEHARWHLLSEGLPHRRIYLTGSPMREVLSFYKTNIENSGILDSLSLTKGGYFVVSTHREENVDNAPNLDKILIVLNELAKNYNLPIIVSTHPRTRKRIEQLGERNLDSKIMFLKPFGFFDYVHLQQNALCTISDSGTISEESSVLGFPAISLRQSMERPEAQDTGSIILTGFDPSVILNSVAMIVDERRDRETYSIPEDYQINDTSWRVVKLIMGNCKLSNSWNGIHEK